MPRRRTDPKPKRTHLDDADFLTRAKRPGERELSAVLGRARRHWDALLVELVRAHPDATVEWKRYGGKTGWRLIVRLKGRNLGHLKPSKGVFTVSLALSDQALDAADKSGLPPEIIAPIQASPRYPEGRAARMDVTSSAGVTLASRLIAIKVSQQGK